MYLFHSSTTQHFFAVFGIVHLENKQNTCKINGTRVIHACSTFLNRFELQGNEGLQLLYTIKKTDLNFKGGETNLGNIL